MRINPGNWLAAGLLAIAGSMRGALRVRRRARTKLRCARSTRIGERLQRWRAKTVAAQYAEDAVLLPPGAPLASGRAAILAFFTKDIAASRAAGAKFVLNPGTAVGISGDLAWASGTYKATVNGAVVESGKFMSVARKKGGKWLYFRDTWNQDSPPGPTAALSSEEIVCGACVSHRSDHCTRCAAEAGEQPQAHQPTLRRRLGRRTACTQAVPRHMRAPSRRRRVTAPRPKTTDARPILRRRIADHPAPTGPRQRTCALSSLTEHASIQLCKLSSVSVAFELQPDTVGRLPGHPDRYFVESKEGPDECDSEKHVQHKERERNAGCLFRGGAEGARHQRKATLAKENSPSPPTR